MSQSPSGMRKASVRRLDCTDCLKWGGTFAQSRDRSALQGLFELGKGNKEIPPGLKQQCKPDTGFGSLNGVRKMFAQGMMQQHLRVGNQPM